MTKTEMNEAWRLIGTYRKGDQRLKDRQLLEAWYLALAPYRFEDVRDAIVARFRKNNYWPDPSEITKELPPIQKEDRRKYAPPTPSELRALERSRAWQKAWHEELRLRGLPTMAQALEQGISLGVWADMVKDVDCPTAPPPPHQ